MAAVFRNVSLRHRRYPVIVRNRNHVHGREWSFRCRKSDLYRPIPGPPTSDPVLILTRPVIFRLLPMLGIMATLFTLRAGNLKSQVPAYVPIILGIAITVLGPARRRCAVPGPLCRDDLHRCGPDPRDRETPASRQSNGPGTHPLHGLPAQLGCTSWVSGRQYLNALQLPPIRIKWRKHLRRPRNGVFLKAQG